MTREERNGIREATKTIKELTDEVGELRGWVAHLAGIVEDLTEAARSDTNESYTNDDLIRIGYAAAALKRKLGGV